MSVSGSTNFHHRSSLKQKNKPFKGTTKAKSASSSGKIDHKTITSHNSSNAPCTLSKADRKNQNKIKQATRKTELADQKKIFTGSNGVPRTVALIPLTPSANVKELLQGIYRGILDGDSVNELEQGKIVYVEPFKQNLRFFTPDRTNLLQVIDTVAAVDTILFVVSAQDECIDILGVDLLEVLRAQGMCTAMACIQHLDSSAVKVAKQHDLKLAWLNSLTFHLASTLHPRIFSSDHFESRRECTEMLRILCQLSIYEGISWRDTHPYMVAENIQLNENTLTLTGRVRGNRSFSPNQLVHLPGVGDFQMTRLIELSRSSSQQEFVAFPEPENQEQLFNPSLNVVEDDQMTPSATNSGNDSISREKLIVRVPKGTSAYQARVIHEAGLDGGVDEKSPLNDNDFIDSDEEELTDVDINENEEDSRKTKERQECEMEEAIQDYAALKRRQLDQSEPLSSIFPDAVEVPEDQPARERFAKYRGVESLRTSEWDTTADCTPQYMENIFEFDNFKLSMKRALSCELESSLVHFKPGSRIQMELSLAHLSAASPEAQSLLALVSQSPLCQVPLCVFGLLPHEQKYSILNLNLLPRSTSTNVRSKEPVLMIYGFRRIEVAPVYSDASHGHSLHTMHRIMPTDRPCTASVLAPIAYPPTSVLFFRAKNGSEGNTNTVSLLASGSLESIKPNRITLKRITFIGYPFKINRRTCTVRFMFFNPSDVNWFRPVELITSRQFRRGHIKESLGTHGYMKCIFDNQIQQNEQIAMHLYKRVFPKWTTRNCCLTNLAIENDRPEENSMQI
jgi:pre-rRNA-processing protein TSR1